MRAATATFHKARYQHAIAAAGTAPAATTTRTTRDWPTAPADSADRQQTQREQQHHQQQQTTNNKTWPPGTSFVSSCRRATDDSTPGRAPPTDNINTSDRGCASRNQRISEPINLFSASSNDSASSSSSLSPAPPLPPPPAHFAKIVNLSRPGALIAEAAYKGVECLHFRRQSRFGPRKRRDAAVQQVVAEPETVVRAKLADRTHRAQVKLASARQSPAAATAAAAAGQPRQVDQHEYQEVSAQDEESARAAPRPSKPEPTKRALVSGSRADKLHTPPTTPVAPKKPLASNNQIAPAHKRKQPKHEAMATLRPISPQYQHTLDSAISLSKELASKNMADSGESSPKTPNSPDKKRFNFKLKHFSKSYSEASASIRDIESSISDEAKQAYKSLVERGQFNLSHQTFGGSRSFNHRNSPNARDYANEDFLTPTTPPATSGKFKCSTFSVKKSFF